MNVDKMTNIQLSQVKWSQTKPTDRGKRNPTHMKPPTPKGRSTKTMYVGVTNCRAPFSALNPWAFPLLISLASLGPQLP